MSRLKGKTARIDIAFQQQCKQKAETAPAILACRPVDSIAILGFQRSANGSEYVEFQRLLGASLISFAMDPVAIAALLARYCLPARHN
jgi:hypothetical protein